MTRANSTHVRELSFMNCATRGEALLNFVNLELGGVLCGEVEFTVVLFRGEASFQLRGQMSPRDWCHCVTPELVLCVF
jgi:hypothetical protein